MTRLYLVRHGRAAAGWNTAVDSELDALGRAQAKAMADKVAPLGPLAVVSSPMTRCRQTAAPLARRWKAKVAIEPRMTEIPSPEGVAMTERVEWLRLTMQGRWSSLDERYQRYRCDLLDYLASLEADTVIASHFVAINVAIGAAVNDDRVVIRSLDNCSVTVMDVDLDGFHLVEGGHEADTLIR